MKQIRFTYHMERLGMVAQSSITLTMKDGIAADILAHGDDSQYMGVNGAAGRVLDAAAELQGYTLRGVCSAELVEVAGNG